MMPRILSGMPAEGRLWIGGGGVDAMTQAGWRAGDTIEIGDGLSLKQLERA